MMPTREGSLHLWALRDSSRLCRVYSPRDDRHLDYRLRLLSLFGVTPLSRRWWERRWWERRWRERWWLERRWWERWWWGRQSSCPNSPFQFSLGAPSSRPPACRVRLVRRENISALLACYWSARLPARLRTPSPLAWGRARLWLGGEPGFGLGASPALAWGRARARQRGEPSSRGCPGQLACRASPMVADAHDT
eukprot:1434436-Pyramimonas_sp.AAC.1